MKSTFYILFLTVIFLNIFSAVAQNNKILFDATKAEMASNADWVIDADIHNIFFSSTTHLPYASSGSGQSNPQRIPTPAQSGITSSTAETYWEGSLSAMAVDCAKRGYIVETLPFNAQITYGNSTNVQDLSNYKVFVVDEPNMSFSVNEKAAIVNFVKNGGGLMMISDHTISDRNFDGVDSPVIWNDLMTNNTVQSNPFGIAFDLQNFSGTYANMAPSTNPYYSSILNGPFGMVNQIKFTNGTSMSLNTTANSSVRGLVYKTSATTATTNVLIAAATYQAGKVFAIGDSSIPDDGTGDPGDTLYNGYTGDAGGNHQRLLMNGMIWLITTTLSTNDFVSNSNHFSIAPNPTQDKQIHFTFSLEEIQKTKVSLLDTLGRTVKEVVFQNELTTGMNYQAIDASDLQTGIYICKFTTPTNTKSLQVIVK
ncbi:T9SS type A sorting domain-containing protein [Flavobacterium sp.]|uniref:T9SS type A sorting domain-containing protein n=1 Tax=Flavobacterium sp. TaxID=239 RepID=UPI0025D96BFC|nr:T9SS type A sorting domain-containing protein [Flavobacterium sp.]